MTGCTLFDRMIIERGAAVGRNGAHYRIVPLPGVDRRFGIERTHKGDRNTIVNYNGNEFRSIESAHRWAICDHRYRMTREAPAWNRRWICDPLDVCGNFGGPTTYDN